MTSLQSSVVGTWLLDRFCGEPAIAGDLLQEYRKGRSTFWYWREVMSAVCAYSTSTIWEHKWLTVRAIATGYLFSFVVIRTGMRDMVHPWWNVVAPPALYPLIAYVPWTVNGYVIGRLHRPYSMAMVFAYAVWLIFRSIGPVYAAGADALAGVQGSAFWWEFSSRLSSMLVMVYGGTLAVYRAQLEAKRTGAVRQITVPQS